jgi:Cytochrome c7 and related cytochrome c
MRPIFEGSEHLIRLAVVAVVLVVAFFAIRHAVVPRNFGEYGFFRPASLGEIAGRTPVFGGREVCATCHVDIATAKSKGPHANVGCEACHGPLGRHAQDFTSQEPVLPDTAKLCVVCHEADSAKPKTFPQVVSREHAGDTACGVCHNPHQPKI